MGFFSELRDDLAHVERKIDQIKVDQDKSGLSRWKSEQYELISVVAFSMFDEPELWEERCSFNIHEQGDKFKKNIKSFINNFSDATIEYLYFSMVRFLVELDLSYGPGGINFFEPGKLSKEITNLKEKVIFNSKEGYSRQFNYIFYQMPIDILCSYMGNKGFKTFLEFDERRNALEESIQQYQNEVNEKVVEVQQRIADVDKLKEKLDEYKTAFNFVGLSQGFENLLKQKNQAKWLTFAVLIFLSIITLAPLCFSFYKKFIANVDISWQSMLPIIGLEFVLIYFFRVVLTHYHSIQTQIMQLELRQSLCQFIQSYAEYAKKIKTDDKDALEKFENLIFSSILSSPDKVPSTFDGMEGLTSLLKELKK